MFVDASALVALIAPQDDAARIATRLDADQDLLWSAMARWETVTALCHSFRYDPAAASEAVGRLAHAKNMRTVTVGEREAALALEAFARYGKGRHAARLNMGDCFAYACAKANNAVLLYKDKDFAETDLA